MNFFQKKKIIGHGHPVKDWLPKAQEPKPTQPQGKGRGRQTLPLKKEEMERKMSRMWTPPSRKRPQGGDADRGWPRIPRETKPKPRGGEAPGRRGRRVAMPTGDRQGSPVRPGPREADFTRERTRTSAKFVLLQPETRVNLMIIS